MLLVSMIAASPVPLGVEATLNAADEISIAAAEDLSEASQFQAGSLAKYVCTLGVLKLVGEGTAQLDTSLKQALPAYSGPDAGSITVRDVLANRSGLPDDLMPAFRADPSVATSPMSALDAANSFAAGAINQEKLWSYDLGNWIIVQALIERASGRSVERFLADAFFIPAALNNTKMADGVPALANSPAPAAPVRPLPGFLKCAGGLVSSPEDLLRLIDWVYTEGLSASSLSALHKVTTPDQNYTLGGRVRMVGGRVLSWQSGSNGPYKTQVVYDTSAGLGWAAMTAANSTHEMAEQRLRWLEAFDK